MPKNALKAMCGSRVAARLTSNTSQSSQTGCRRITGGALEVARLPWPHPASSILGAQDMESCPPVASGLSHPATRPWATQSLCPQQQLPGEEARLASNCPLPRQGSPLTCFVCFVKRVPVAPSALTPDPDSSSADNCVYPVAFSGTGT